MTPRPPKLKFGFALSPSAGKEFAAAARWRGLTSAELSAMLAKQFLADCRKTSPTIGFTGEIAISLQRRLAVVKQWRVVRRRTAKGKVRYAAVAFVRQILEKRNVKISVRTLYGWDEGYTQRGPAGLIDHRRWKPYVRPASGGRQPNAGREIEAPSNGVQ